MPSLIVSENGSFEEQERWEMVLRIYFEPDFFSKFCDKMSCREFFFVMLLSFAEERQTNQPVLKSLTATCSLIFSIEIMCNNQQNVAVVCLHQCLLDCWYIVFIGQVSVYELPKLTCNVYSDRLFVREIISYILQKKIISLF